MWYSSCHSPLFTMTFPGRGMQCLSGKGRAEVPCQFHQDPQNFFPGDSRSQVGPLKALPSLNTSCSFHPKLETWVPKVPECRGGKPLPVRSFSLLHRLHLEPWSTPTGILTYTQSLSYLWTLTEYMPVS